MKIRGEFRVIRRRVRWTLGLALVALVPIVTLPGTLLVAWFSTSLAPVALLVLPVVVAWGLDRASKPYLKGIWRCPECHCYLDRLHPFIVRPGRNYCPYCSARLFD